MMAGVVNPVPIHVKLLAKFLPLLNPCLLVQFIFNYPPVRINSFFSPMAAVFTINGKLYNVTSEDVPADTSLNTFIRNYAHLSGTKFMCLEGGCGVCIVNVKGIHPVTKEITSYSINSCLFSVFSCHGMDIVTIEGIGSKVDGYHPVQQRLAFLNGTQCGFCSPGMVMSMYSLMDSNHKQLTMGDIENSIDSNICRCTGYRPILDAFKSFACDASSSLLNMCRDIEDLEKGCSSKTKGISCRGVCSPKSVSKGSEPVNLYFKDGRQWHKVYSIDSVFDILNKNGSEPYMVVAGNTGHGVYRRNADLKVFIDVNSVEELHSHWMGSELIVGANVTLTEFINILKIAASKNQKFKYCAELAEHVTMVAHAAVRNVGTLAGNLSLKHQHHEFPSDIYLILESVGAQLTIMSADGMMEKATPQEYLQKNMDKKILTSIVLPALDPAYHFFRSYKVQPRTQNAKAYVNGAFMVKFTATKTVIDRASICYGGIHPSFTHAIETEKLLVGKNLFRNATIQEALGVLDEEIDPDWVLPDPSPEFRKQAALGLFYRSSATRYRNAIIFALLTGFNEYHMGSR